MISSGLADFKLAYQANPIFLTGGIAGNMPGGAVPLLSYTQGLDFTTLISGGGDSSLDNLFASFLPVPGSSLISNLIGTYPFANQATAANAIITSPLNISVMMICPARGPGDYSTKLSIITGLKATLDQHIMNGGTFAIATPSFFYFDCLMTGMRDASSGETHQAQYRWQLDFQKPLVSLEEAQQKQNNLMSKIGPEGTKVTPDASGAIPWSSPANTVGNPDSGATAAIVPPGGNPGLSFNTLRSGTGPTEIPSGSGVPPT